MNEQIQRWRERVRTTGGVSENELDELESHLRESAENLTRIGLAADEAVAVASMRLGSAGQLAEEYARTSIARTWLPRVKWMLIGAMAVQVALSLRSPFQTLLYSLARDLDGIHHPLQTGAHLFVAQYVVGPLYVAVLAAAAFRFRNRLANWMSRGERFCGRRPVVAFCLLVMAYAVLPISVSLVPELVFESVNRFLAETPGAIRYDWANISITVVTGAIHGFSIGAVVWWLHRWERNVRNA